MNPNGWTNQGRGEKQVKIMRLEWEPVFFTAYYSAHYSKGGKKTFTRYPNESWNGNEARAALLIPPERRGLRQNI